MRFLEKDLEDIIWESDRDLLMDRGLYVTGHMKRQLRIGNYGIADLVTFKREYYGCNRSILEINIYEIKRGDVGVAAFLQSMRYATGIRSYLEQRGIDNFNITITLIGDSLELSSEFVYIENFMSSCGAEFNVYTYEYKIDGIKFKRESGYKMMNEGFNL